MFWQKSDFAVSPNREGGVAMARPEDLTDGELMFEILNRCGWTEVELEEREFYHEVRGKHPLYAYPLYAGAWLMFGAKGRLEDMLIRAMPTPQQILYAHRLSQKIMNQILEAKRDGDAEAHRIVEECRNLKSSICSDANSEEDLFRTYSMLAATPREGGEVLFSILTAEKEMSA